MKHIIIITLAFILIRPCLAQNDLVRDYNQLQRDIQFQKYMDNVSSKGLAGPNNMKFDYTLDKGALNDMLKMWERRDVSLSNGQSKKKDEELKSRYLEKYYKELREDMANDDREFMIMNIKKEIVDYYMSNGFPQFEARNISHEHVYQENKKVVVKDYNDGTLAVYGLSIFNREKETASFDELLGYVYMMSRASYTALKSLEYLESRFPDKKSTIAILKPIIGLNMFKSSSVNFENSEFPEEYCNEIMTYFDEWIDKYPELVVECFENKQIKYNLGYVGRVYGRATKYDDIRRVKLIKTFLNYGKYSYSQKARYFMDGITNYYDLIYVVTRPKKEKVKSFYIKRFTYDDIVEMMNRYNINSIDAFNLLGIPIQKNDRYGQYNKDFEYIDFGFNEEIRRLAQNGDIYMQYFDAMRKSIEGNKMEKLEANAVFKKLIDDGHTFPTSFVAAKGLMKDIGYDKKKFEEKWFYNKKLRDIFDNRTPIFDDKSRQPYLLKRGDTIFSDWKSSIDKFQFESITTNNNSASVDVSFKDNQVYYENKNDNRTWNIINVSKENYSDFIYETEFQLAESGGYAGAIGIVLGLNSSNSDEDKQIIFRIKPANLRIALSMFDLKSRDTKHLLLNAKNEFWVEDFHIREPKDKKFMLTVRKVGNSFYFFVNHLYVASFGDQNYGGAIKSLGITTQEKAKGKVNNISFVSNIKD